MYVYVIIYSEFIFPWRASAMLTENKKSLCLWYSSLVSIVYVADVLDRMHIMITATFAMISGPHR